MNHNESEVKVHYSTEYSRFRMINGNRQLNEPKINRIIKEIKSGNDMLRYYPIQVKQNKDRLDILDGQHRFYICKKLKVPVFYILVKEEKSMPEIAKINSNVGKWKSTDYVNCYVQSGNNHYKKLQEFLDDYKFSMSVSLLLLTTGTPGSEGSYPNLTEDFHNGNFTVQEWDKAKLVAENCKQFTAFPNWRSRPFVIAIYRIMKAGFVSIDDVLTAYNKRPEYLTEQANYKAYINIIEQMMNVGKQKRIVIV